MPNNLDFISENIYHLKREYGISIVVGHQTTVSNLQTGVKTITKDEFTIQLAIALPFNYRQMFAKLEQNRKQGYIQSGDRQILIDIIDIPAGKTIEENYYILRNGKRSDITKVERYDEALILTVKNIAGMPVL